MLELTPKTPAAGLTPVTVGTMTLTEPDLGQLTLITPFKGQVQAVSDAMLAAHGMALPDAGQTTGQDGARAIWFGLGQTLLAGPAADASLGAGAALVDQSDAWAVLQLRGDELGPVLARLVPVDIRAASFAVGQTIRTELAHMMASVTRVADDAVVIMVFRSMAHTAVHELRDAMEAVAARG